MYVLFCIFLMNISSASCAGDSLLRGVFWEVKPFIFSNPDGTLDGIIPRMFREGQYYCTGNKTLLEFVLKEDSRKSFYDLLRSNISYGQDRLSKFHPSQTIVWAPVISFDEGAGVKHERVKHERERGLRSFELLKSTEMAVIVPRYMISLPNKILRGILSCGQIIIIALLLSVLFGIIIWLTERLHNEEFSKSFIRGAGTGFWWSLVSMTTVGYGDVVPRSLLGRIVAMVWIFIGVMIACVMTATTTEIVTGVDDLNVYGKTVSVLENSVEAKVASEDFRANIVPAASYEEVLQLLRDGKVFAAMINADVAAWYQEDIQGDNTSYPLRIVQKVPASLYINCLISVNVSEETKNTFRCMYQMKDEVYTRSIERFRRYCHTERLYLDSLQHFFQHLFIQILLAIIILFVMIGFGFEFYLSRMNSTKKPTMLEKGDSNITMDLLYNGENKNLHLP